MPFLTGVTALREPPRATLVLLRNFRYRLFYEIFRRFTWALRITQPAAAEPEWYRLTTQRVWETYQVWCFLQVVTAVEEVIGRRPTMARGIAEVLDYSQLVVRVTAESSVRVSSGENTVLVRYKPTFASRSGAGPRSIGYPKYPDITVETDSTRSGIIFDAKYRLDFDGAPTTMTNTAPAAGDIDKMHAYRDAIRLADGRPYAARAYVLYPGNKDRLLDDGRLEALGLLPGRSMKPLIEVIRTGLSEAA